MTFHPFHLVEKSPWPLTASLAALCFTVGMVSLLSNLNSYLIYMSMIIFSLTTFQWWRDISRESSYQGLHTSQVTLGMKWGMILFIISEIFFFLGFFWAFFHSSLSPTMEVGSLWPPKEIIPFNPFQIPLLNTAILLASGITVTWAHHSMMNNNFSKTKKSLIITIILGVYFTVLQGFEYFQAPFSIADSIYGAIFYMATGFHGFHVLVGTSFLTVCLFRHLNHLFSSDHHFGFEAAAWYWHFVDVVWLFLYISIYWWGK